jgi:hypothetical protein
LKKSDKFEWTNNARGVEDLPHDASDHGAPSTQRDLATLHLRVHLGGQCGSSG